MRKYRLDVMLYKACQFQVREFSAECGMTLAELWDCVHGRGRNAEHGGFWHEMVIAEYLDYLDPAGDRVNKFLDRF